MERKALPPDTVVRYAVYPPAAGAIKYVDGLPQHWPALPQVGAVLTVPFLLDPASGLPMPVRVLEIQERLEMTPPTLVVVVGPAH